MVYKAFVLHIQTVEVRGRGAKPFVRAISHHAEPIAGAYPEQNLADVGSAAGEFVVSRFRRTANIRIETQPHLDHVVARRPKCRWFRR